MIPHQDIQQGKTSKKKKMCKFYDILQIRLLTPPTPPSCDKKNYDKMLILFRPTPPKEIMTKKNFSQGFSMTKF